MATNVNLNAVTYAIPATGENSWGDAVSSYLIALATGVLTKAGGSFTLTAETDFGATYGLKSTYYKSRATNPASAGVLRLGNAEYVYWRNAANGADLGLRANASDRLEYNAVVVPTISSTDTLTNKTLDFASNTVSNIVNANISASAAIAYSKLALTGAILNADLAGSIAYSKLSLTAAILNADLAGSIAYSKLSLTGAVLNADLAGSIAYSKLSLAGALLNADINASAAIAYSKLTLTGAILNADVNASAAIAYSKLALTGSVLNADLAGSIAYGKLSLTGAILNADVSASAAIAYSKLALTGAVVLADLAAAIKTGTGTKLATDIGASIASPTISDYALLTESAAPSTPASGKVAIYAKTDKKIYKKNSDGVEAEVGAGTASGGAVNYISNTSFEDNNVTGWATYLDAAAITPVDGTAGTAVSTFASSATTPLRGTYSGLFTKGAANRQGEGFSYDFTIAAADKSLPLVISWEGLASANYTGSTGTEYMSVYVYDVTNSTLIYPASTVVAQGSSKGKSFFVASTSTSYRLIFHVAGTGTSAWTYQIDSVSVGPQSLGVGAAVTDFVSFTPTGSWTTNATYTGQYRRVGDMMHYRGKIATSGAPDSGALTVNLPTGFTIDTTKVLDVTAPNMSFGEVRFNDSGTAYTGHALYSSTTAISLYVLKANADYTFDTGATYILPFTFASGDSVTWDVWVPISTWSSNVTLADRALEEYASLASTWDASDTTASGTVSGPAGSVMGGALAAARTKRIVWQNPRQATDNVFVEIDQLATGNWQQVPVSGFADSPSSVNDFGVACKPVSGQASQTDVVFSRYRTTATNAWDSTARWRVRKVSGGGVCGFPVSSANLVGRTDGVAPSAGYVGEILTASATGASVTSTQYTDAVSLSLTAGIWDVTGACTFSPAATTSITRLGTGISVTSGNSATGLTNGSSLATLYQAAMVPANDVVQLAPTVRVVISATTIHYLKAIGNFSISTMTVAGFIRAVRVA